MLKHETMPPLSKQCPLKNRINDSAERNNARSENNAMPVINETMTATNEAMPANTETFGLDKQRNNARD